jgi:hypothetical protein
MEPLNSSATKVRWTRHLRPIWVGIGIGFVLGAVLLAVSMIVGPEYEPVTASAEGYGGRYGGTYHPGIAIPLFPAFGFFLGLLVAMYRKGRSPEQV